METHEESKSRAILLNMANLANDKRIALNDWVTIRDAAIRWEQTMTESSNTEAKSLAEILKGAQL